MTTLNKRISFTLIIIGLFFIGPVGWKILSPAPNPGAATMDDFHKQGERFSSQDSSLWPQSNLDWRTSPVDLSFLNASEKPAGRRGFVKAKGDALEFEDGSPARFWGTNLTARALFGASKENVKLLAKRLSALGFNLVRIHHFDSPWVNPNIFGKDAKDT